MSGGKYWSADNMFGSLESQRADDAEAMFMGTAIGAAKAVAKINDRHDAEILELEKILGNAVGNQVNLAADRDAYKRLSEAMVAEGKNPESERRFSAPNADLERGQLLQDTFRQSWEATVKRAKASGNETLTSVAIETARDKSYKTLNEYRDKAVDAHAANRTQRGPKQN